MIDIRPIRVVRVSRRQSCSERMVNGDLSEKNEIRLERLRQPRIVDRRPHRWTILGGGLSSVRDSNPNLEVEVGIEKKSALSRFLEPPVLLPACLPASVWWSVCYGGGAAVAVAAVAVTAAVVLADRFAPEQTQRSIDLGTETSTGHERKPEENCIPE